VVATDDLGPEDHARQDIDKMLEVAGWIVQSRRDVNVRAGLGVAVRDRRGAADPDYLLVVNGRACGVAEAKPVGHTLTGVEGQSGRYLKSLAADIPAWSDPLRFSYETTGVETQFTEHADPDPRSRHVFAIHRPETLHTWLRHADDLHAARPTLRHRLRSLPPIPEQWTWGWPLSLAFSSAAPLT
jgi:type I restriction enzyme, R subunit